MLAQPTWVHWGHPTREICSSSALPVPVAAVQEAERGCSAGGSSGVLLQQRGESRAGGRSCAPRRLHLPLCLSFCPTAERELPRAGGVGWAAVGAVCLPWPGRQDDPQGHGTLSCRVLPERGRYRRLPASLPLRTAK